MKFRKNNRQIGISNILKNEKKEEVKITESSTGGNFEDKDATSGDEDDDIGELVSKKVSANSSIERRTSSSSTCSSASTWSSRRSSSVSSHRSR